jgi:hypothetical protein
VIPEGFITETRLLGAAIASLDLSAAIASIEPETAVAIGTALVLHLPRGSVFDTVVTTEQLAGGQLIASVTLQASQKIYDRTSVSDRLLVITVHPGAVFKRDNVHPSAGAGWLSG